METNVRSIAKAVSYRLLGSSGTTLVIFLISGNFKLSLGAGAIDMLLKIGLYFLHERIWNLIPYGRARQTAPEYEI